MKMFRRSGKRSWRTALQRNGFHRKWQRNSATGKQWPLKQQVQFFTVLNDFLQEGFTLRQALRGTRQVILRLTQDIDNFERQLDDGSFFSAAVRPRISVASYLHLALAEEHGCLKATVAVLARELSRRYEYRRRIRGLLAYPCGLLVMLLGIIGAVHWWLMPMIRQFVPPQPETAPNWTLVVRIITGILLCGGGIYCARVVVWWWRQRALNRHIWYSQLPVIGRFYRYYCAYIISFNLGQLLVSGLELAQVGELLLRFPSSSVLHQLGVKFIGAMMTGNAIKNFTGQIPFIPDEVAAFFERGQATKTTGQSLLMFADVSYRRFIRALDRLLTWIQPLFFIVIAVLIIGTYVVILVPLYSSIGRIN
ncbi:type II secretion system F family protein [Ligilactobacillus hohenheimensis]|uniref:type II secretion system F family protein n=1 Tax=Ligilactobacillus hohenheimensis TaxID=2991832 RepID=UPI0024BAFF24|nr:type II secretion system F family protein [Ligilactobacillus hohenheimensis]